MEAGTSRSLSGEKSQENKVPASTSPPHATIPEEPSSILDRGFVTSPTATSPPPDFSRRSVESRPDSKLSQAAAPVASMLSRSSSDHPASPPPPERQTPSEPQQNIPPRFQQSPRIRATSPPRAASPPKPQLPQAEPTAAPDTPNSVRIVPPRSMSQSSIPTSLYTIATPTSRVGHGPLDQSRDKPAPPLPPQSFKPPPPAPEKSTNEADDILGDAGAALFYMQHMQQQEGAAPVRKRGPPPKAPPSDEEDEEESASESDSEPYTPPPRAAISPLRVRHASPPPQESQSPPAVPAKSPRPPADQRVSTPTQEAPAAPRPGSGLRNRPSGARAAPSSKRMSAFVQNSFSPTQTPSEPATDTTTTTTAPATDREDDKQNTMAAAVQDHAPAHEHGFDDPAADALAALSFLEREERPAPPPAAPQSPSQTRPTAPPSSPPLPEFTTTPASPSQTRANPAEPRSSFAPTRLAAERKAKSQAQQAALQAAAHRPGKANGRKGRPAADSGAWGESSEEEEEEEEEEEDDEVDSDEEPAPRRTSVSDQASALGHGAPPSAGARSPYAQTSAGSPARSQVDVNAGAYPGSRQARNLPQVPGQRLPGSSLLPPASCFSSINLLLFS